MCVDRQSRRTGKFTVLNPLAGVLDVNKFVNFILLKWCMFVFCYETCNSGLHSVWSGEKIVGDPVL